MGLKIWLDGKLLDRADAKICLYDHGLLYGDGVFEGIRVYNGKVFEIDAHLRRLYDSAQAIRLTIPMTPAEIKAAIEQTFRANRFTDCYLRVVVTRGVGDLGINPLSCQKPTVFIISDLISVYPSELYENGISAIFSSYTRNHPNSTSPRIKSLNYLNNVLAKIEANDAGVAEAIFLNHLGNVAECSADNIFLVRDQQVLTPGTAEGLLEGVTRKVIFDLCARDGIPCLEKVLQRHDVYSADEIFVTGTGAEVMPVTTVDGRTIGSGKVGPVTGRLIRLFHQHIRG